jgi:hypothetical protein
MIRVSKDFNFWRKICWVTLLVLGASTEGLHVFPWRSNDQLPPEVKDVEYLQRYVLYISLLWQYYFNACLLMPCACLRV